jgi:hypothetical protein
MASAKSRVRKLNKLLSRLNNMKGIPGGIKEAVIAMRDEAEYQSRQYTWEDVFMTTYRPSGK